MQRSLSLLAAVSAAYEGKGMPIYSVISGNADNLFAIDSRTGAITVSEDKSLGCDPASARLLGVGVSDGECRDTALITLNMQEIIPGDTDANGKVGLGDTTSALRILMGDYKSDVNLCADVSGDENIGVEELVHILKSLTN